ncbi:hypothetical protein BDP27DRAFT_1427996 [Rhodocollybia butyracea]|uniref:Uncharacterized protein n=1 Tax=Rhodocollybia butyracea TaxID=206335 RepID=A0A9P5PFI3_9AGAR|nr:hypothetical protein BDP27DRAFT_1427996 [Rhodocollybia butyracea]
MFLKVLKLQESLLAPVRTLPSDIITAIFQLFIETSSKPGITYSTENFYPTKLSGSIFLLTWICFWWRHEAISYSIFWSRIKVALHFQYGSPRSIEMTAFLTECFLRSGVSVPLSIGVVSSHILPSVITMLTAQAHRWRQATLSLGSAEHVNSLFDFEPSSMRFPLLKDLSFEPYPGWTRDTVVMSNRILECHPPLQKLELDELLESYADVIASRNLKILKLGCYWGVSLARLLHICPCLEFLKLESFKFRGNPDVKQITCQSSLLTLVIGGHIKDEVENGPGTVLRSPS